MGRLILLILIVAAAAWLITAFRRRLERAPRRQVSGRDRQMVQCRDCGLYLPADEASSGPGGYYCDKHRPGA